LIPAAEYLPGKAYRVRDGDEKPKAKRMNFVLTGVISLFPGNFPSSPKAFIGDPLLLKKNRDSRSKALRERRFMMWHLF
jgi:hypothetical protein